MIIMVRNNVLMKKENNNEKMMMMRIKNNFEDEGERKGRGEKGNEEEGVPEELEGARESLTDATLLSITK